MKQLKNDRGVVLITTLMLTLIAFGISMVMLYLVLQGTKLSGTSRQYKNSLEAGLGGVEIMTKEALPALLNATTSFIDGTSPADYFKNNLASSLPGLDASSLVMINNRCLNAKLTSRSWGTACGSASLTLNAKESADLTFNLRSAISAAATGYKVYTKIVSTTPGSTDMSGRDLEGQPTTGAPMQDVGAPYLYRIEVASERVSNPQEKATLSVLYAY
jgi:hypothetical protein